MLANSMDCVNQASADDITLEPSALFFDVLSRKTNEQALVAGADLPQSRAGVLVVGG